MMDINTYFRDEPPWYIFGRTFIQGNAFLDGRLLDEAEISKLVSSSKRVDDFISLLKRFNGFYAIVHEGDNKLFAAVDRRRSIPLFYSLKDNELNISNDPHWIRKRIGDNEIDELSATEFSLVGFVTGKDTLYPHVKQLGPGEVLCVVDTLDGPDISFMHYYRYNPGNYHANSGEKILADLDRVLLNVFKRLVRWADGRTIIVPLSGGYDSKLVVLMLKRLDYNNIITFSYGKPGNQQSEISREVASSLGIRWEFVPYSNESWYRWFHSEEFRKYCHMANGLCSVPHIQEWPAVWELRKQGLIPEKSVFVTGGGVNDLDGMPYFDSMDSKAIYSVRSLLLSGSSRLDPSDNWSSDSNHAFEENPINGENVIDLIYKKRYCMLNLPQHEKSPELKLKEKIKMIVGLDNSFSGKPIFHIPELWDVQEIDIKLFANSVRTFEFWGYKWWLPLWDSELVDFWSRLRVEDKLEKNLYKTYVNNLSKEIIKKNIEANPSERSWKNSKLLQLSLFDGFIKTYRLHKNYERHPLAWYGIISKNEFKKIYTGKENIVSFLALKMLKNMKSNAENPVQKGLQSSNS
jgi:asparagine synthase (glutamine-hydrolysing)